MLGLFPNRGHDFYAHSPPPSRVKVRPYRWQVSQSINERLRPLKQKHANLYRGVLSEPLALSTAFLGLLVVWIMAPPRYEAVCLLDPLAMLSADLGDGRGPELGSVL